MQTFKPTKLAMAIAVSGMLAGTTALAQVEREEEQSTWENRDPATQTQQQQTDPRDQSQDRYNTQTQRQQTTSDTMQSDENKQVISFEFDSSELTDEGKQKLEEVVQTAKQQQAQVKVEGYTDNSGPEVYNEYLAKQRAEAVQEYLHQQGIQQVEVEVKAEEDPIASNDTREGRAQNRRVEVSIASAETGAPTDSPETGLGQDDDV